MKTPPAKNPEEYVAGLEGWRLECVTALRAAVHATPRLQEEIKWGHLVYSFDGPLLLIRAEAERVLFGFWRGKRLRDLEPRLKASGKYEMATIELREGDSLKSTVARRLVKAARKLNEELGDPRDAAKPERRGSQKG